MLILNRTLVNLQVGSYLNAVQIFVTSGVSGTTNPHLHFAGMVGGTSTLNNAINPMRIDSLPYINSPPADILITDSGFDFLKFQIQSPKNDLDLNEIEVGVIDVGGTEEDFFP